MDGVGDFESVLLTDPKNLHHDRGLSVESGPLVGFREAVNHFGHVAEDELCAVRLGHQSQVFKLGAVIGLPLGSKQDLAAPGLQRPSRQVDGRAPDRIRHSVETQPVAAHGFFRDLDRDLVGGSVDDFRLGNLRQRDQIFAHPLGQLLECQLVGVARDRDIHDLEAVRDFLNGGLFRLFGKCIDRVDAGFDVVERPSQVVSRQDLNGNGATAFSGQRPDLLDSIQVLDRFLDPNAYAFLDLFRSGSALGNADADHIDGVLGENFLLDSRDGHEPANDDYDHHEVGGHAVVREPGNDSFLHR